MISWTFGNPVVVGGVASETVIVVRKKAQAGY